MNKREYLLDELHKLSALIMKARIENKPQASLRKEFAQKQGEYKRFWLKDYKKTL
jgi:hypothetical protein